MDINSFGIRFSYRGFRYDDDAGFAMMKIE